jgi:hypothetical protein
MTTQRTISQSIKKSIITRQHYKCANSPGSKLMELEDFECPLWEKHNGKFIKTQDDKSYVYKIDNIIERAIGGTNELDNLQALCVQCYTEKKTNFMRAYKTRDNIVPQELLTLEMAKQKGISYKFFMDYTNFANKDIDLKLAEEWLSNSIVFIENCGKMFVLIKNKDTCLITNEETIYYTAVTPHSIHKHLSMWCNITNPNFDPTLYNTNERKDVTYTNYVNSKKYLYTHLSHTSPTVKGFLYNYQQRRCYDYPSRSYTNIEFYPYLERKGKPDLDGAFNIFLGFSMDKIDLKQKIDFKKSKLYSYLRDEIMNSNYSELNHFFDYISDIIQDPTNIKASVHIFHIESDTGKNILIEFLNKLLGNNNVATYENTSLYFRSKHDRTNKLLKIFKGTIRAHHKKLENEVRKESETTKFNKVHTRETLNCSRIILLTSDKTNIDVEDSEVQYTYHQANHIDHQQYLKPIIDEITNIQFCRNMFEFFATRKYNVNNVTICYKHTLETTTKIRSETNNKHDNNSDTKMEVFSDSDIDTEKKPRKRSSTHVKKTTKIIKAHTKKKIRK